MKKRKNKVDPETKRKMELVIYDALNFRAAKMLFPYKDDYSYRSLVEVDFAKIAKTFKWRI